VAQPWREVLATGNVRDGHRWFSRASDVGISTVQRLEIGIGGNTTALLLHPGRSNDKNNSAMVEASRKSKIAVGQSDCSSLIVLSPISSQSLLQITLVETNSPLVLIPISNTMPSRVAPILPPGEKRATIQGRILRTRYHQGLIPYAC